MVSSRRQLADLVSAAGWRLLLAITLGVTLVLLAIAQRYATAMLVAVALMLTLIDLGRLGRRRQETSADPAMERLVRRTDEAIALLDAVTVALLLVDEQKHVRFANRAGRMLAGFDGGRLEDIPGLGPAGAAVILSLPPGGRQLVSLADGRTLLVWAESLTVAGRGAHLLISAQTVTGELDAVQVGAWHMMTRVLAHEMMNTLTPIVSLSESIARLMDDPGVDQRVAAAVSTIRRRSEHLIGFVERYRAIVDLPVPRVAPVDLAAFLASMDALIGADLRARGIDFAVEPATIMGGLSADVALLEQAVLNVVKNAGEAVAGLPDARIRLAVALGAGTATITVSDNGPGIADDQIDEIFVPFYTTRQDGGGIGLTLARQIAVAHGGRLAVRTLTPRGVAFEFRLPAA